MAKVKSAESKGYQKMLESVESIVENLEGDNLDLDHMVNEIERGYGIIKTMRERLSSTKDKIERLRESHEKLSSS